MRYVRAAIAIFAVALCGADGRADAGPVEDDERGVRLEAVPVDDAILEPVPVLDRLADGDVLDVTVVEGVAGARGDVQQCTRTVGGVSGCRHVYPVQFADRGDARFLYRLTDTGSCGPDGSCVLVVDDRGGERRAMAAIVFGAPAPPPPVVSIVPARAVEEGDEVAVRIGGLVPGARVRIGYCDPECATARVAAADAQGRLAAAVVIGPDCARCGIAVVGSAHDTLVQVPFAAPPEPGYDTGRVAIGLLVAAVLLVAAWRIVVTVDWRPPSEAATPELDAFEL